MTFTPEQVEEVKKQIAEQTKNLPEEQKRQIEEQVNKMSPEQLEAFVKQQMASSQQDSSAGSPQKGIFRMIVDSDIPSKKIDENKDVIAVVSKRAVSKGHVLIIPKKAIGDIRNLPSSALTMAKKIAKKMTSKLNVENVEIQTETAFGEIIVNVMPVYKTPVNISSQRYEVSDEEMNEIFELLRVVKKPKTERIKKPKSQAKIVKLKRRIA